MENLKFGGPNDIAVVVEQCPADAFDNVIRRYGVVAACGWFGHEPDSDFTKETIRVLMERSTAGDQE